MSDFSHWDQKSHAKEYLIFEQNIGERLSIDETSLCRGELYTILSNKIAKGKKGSIVAIIEGTCSEKIIKILKKISISKRNQVKEITLDMASSMNKIVKQSFPNAQQVTDRFHVQKLVLEAVQKIRIEYRWQAIDNENQAILEAKTNQEKYKPTIFENGDTPKQLLARSRYILFKSRDKWTSNQKIRANILFENYPDIEQAYNLSQSLRAIFNKEHYCKSVARTKLALWYSQVEKTGFKAFNIAANTIENNYETILNYFHNRSTNASAESLNAKIKAFRARFRGVKNIEFFFFRLSSILA